jgi:hypothetical protein
MDGLKAVPFHRNVSFRSLLDNYPGTAFSEATFSSLFNECQIANALIEGAV